MLKRIGPWQTSRRAIAADFRYTFDSRGKANIFRQPGSKVYGAVYQISEAQIRKLDPYEGATRGIYRRFRIKVMTDWRDMYATTYKRTVDTPFRAPDQSYLNLILEGLAEHGYPESVISEMRAIAQEHL